MHTILVTAVTLSPLSMFLVDVLQFQHAESDAT